MENKILLIIIFSFNRAMQLDCLLRTTFKHLKHPDYEIRIIYNATGKHHNGYEKLIEKYSSHKNIEFIKEKDKSIGFIQKLPFLFKNRNFWRYVKHSYLRKKLSNFKFLTEKAIKDSEAEFTMFMTDDGYFFRDVKIPEKILDLIRKDPYRVSYKMYVGKNLDDCPQLEKENGLLTWDYYDSRMHRHWAYPFSVDVTIYKTEALLKLISPVLYHMPTTLESFVVTHCRKRKLLNRGYSPKESNYAGIYINRVATVGNNFAGNISEEMLNNHFLEGYTLDFEFKQPPIQQTIIPDKIILQHPEKESIIIEP